MTLTKPMPTVSGLTSIAPAFFDWRLRRLLSSLSPPSLSSSVEAVWLSQLDSAERCRLKEWAGTRGDSEGEREWPEWGEDRDEVYELGE